MRILKMSITLEREENGYCVTYQISTDTFEKTVEYETTSFEEAFEEAVKFITEKFTNEAKSLESELLEDATADFVIDTDWGEVDLRLEVQNIFIALDRNFASYEGIITKVEPLDLDQIEDKEKYEYVVNYYLGRYIMSNNTGWWEILK